MNNLTKEEVQWLKDHIRVYSRDELPKLYRIIKDDAEMREWILSLSARMLSVFKFRYQNVDELS